MQGEGKEGYTLVSYGSILGKLKKLYFAAPRFTLIKPHSTGKLEPHSLSGVSNHKVENPPEKCGTDPKPKPWDSGLV